MWIDMEPVQNVQEKSKCSKSLSCRENCGSVGVEKKVC